MIKSKLIIYCGILLIAALTSNIFLEDSIKDVGRMNDSDTLNVVDFGVSGNGLIDVTQNLQKIFNIAAKENKKVYFPKGVYKVTSLRVKNGIKEIYGGKGSEIRGSSTKGEAILEIDGNFFNGQVVSNLNIHDLEINCNNIARRAIFVAGGVNQSKFHNLTIDGLANTETSETGIYLHFGCNNNIVQNNIINLGKTSNDLVGIHIVGETKNTFASWGEKSDKFAIISSHNNFISKNIIEGGTHGIALFGATENDVEKNEIRNASQRGIILSPLCSNNNIIDNNIYDFGSSGIHLAYNSNNNKIIGNSLVAPNSSGEGGIQAYVGCSGNVIENNSVLCTSNYGIYLGVDTSENTVKRNTIKGGVKIAMICIESDWRNRDSYKVRSNFSRPNYADPPNGGLRWANGNSSKNIIMDNQIVNSNSSTANIALIQIGQHLVYENVVSNNIINGKVQNNNIKIENVQ